MAPKKKTIDKVPAGTSDTADSGSTSNVIGGNKPTLDPGKDPSQMASAISDEYYLSYHMKHLCRQPARQNSKEKYLMIAKGKSSIHPRDPTRDPNNEEIDPHSERPINWSNSHVDEESTNGQPNIEPELIQSTARSNNRSGTKHALGKADHLNQAATAARSTRMDENAREEEIRDISCKSIQYAPFDSIEDKDTDSETTVRNPWEGSIPFQHLDERDILDMSNNKSDNTLVRMIKYMLDQNNHTTMEKSPLAKAGVKVTPPNKYSGEQSFEALETFIKGLLRWLDMHSMLGPDAYKYQVSFLGTRLEGKALEWFDKTAEPRKYQGTPMDLEQVMTGLYGQYTPSLARHKAGTLSVQEFTTELELHASQMVQRPDVYSLCKKFVDNLQPGLRSLLLRAGYDPEKKAIHKLYLKVVKHEDTNRYDIGDNNVSSNARHKPRNNGPDRTKNRADSPKLGEINKGPSITSGPSGQMNHELSHNSIECYNCGKSGHIKPNCPEPIRARCIGAVHVEDSPEGQVDNADLDINDNIDDEHLDEDGYRNDEYDNQLELSEDQRSWSSKPTSPSKLSQIYSHDLARIAAVVPIGLANAREAKIAKEGEPLYDHMVKMKTNRPARSKHDLLTIAGYFLVGGTKARCLFNSGCEGIIMSSEFARAIGLRMHKLSEPIGIQQAFQGSRVKLYYTVTMDITIGQRMNFFSKAIKANIDFNDLGFIVINGETIDNDLSVWLTSEEVKVHGMSINKVTQQEEKPLELIVEQLSIRTKGKSFEMVRNTLLVVPAPQTREELKMLISLVAYMLPYCGCIKRPLDMLWCIYMDKPYVCNKDV
ncbi:hypothetical protein M422DRAFT_273515 [Sphaerobolus stellatus SS14]|uniref:CCHC-type domain-containing protein n=1 Tax=Sphaerobolus stellatus (strain SS14) TaxID=990650 RepID=A0A0C9UJV0_SPHS4|nr:hypothetical protein M422DRAFT_273515 [Sphaerobolus stellatus SS14]